MHQCGLLGWLLLAVVWGGGDGKAVPIVYVFKISTIACSRYTFPAYIVHTLQQAVMSQPDSDVIMASNYAECPNSNLTVAAIPGVTLVDTSLIASPRTLEFVNTSADVFQSDGRHELWITSALRFLNLEDIMRELNLTEIFHVEADNLLYGQLSFLSPAFRASYPALAATPLTANKYFLTASLFWVPTLAHLVHFNDFLLRIGRTVKGSDRGISETSWHGSGAGDGTRLLPVEASTDPNATAHPTAQPTPAPTPVPGYYGQYIDYLRPKACCRWGGPGHPRDENGTLLPGHTGIKPFMINEMSLLAFYKQLFPGRLLALPVVPQVPYNLNRWVCNMSEFGPLGREVGPPLYATSTLITSASATASNKTALDFLFDPNSYGQFLGGTFRSGKRGYQDITHIVGQAMRTTGCHVTMLCGNSSMYIWRNISEPQNRKQAARGNTLCYTAPFVFCGTFFPGGLWKPTDELKTNNSTSHFKSSSNQTDPHTHRESNDLNSTTPQNNRWNAIVNLHVHSKNTAHFVSQPCMCDL